MPQVPVIDITDTGNGTPVIPYFAVGGAGSVATTDLLIINATDQQATGTFSFVDQGTSNLPAQPVEMTIHEQSGTEFPYDLPPRSSRRFPAQASVATTRKGSIRVNPSAGNPVPAAFAVISTALGSTIYAQQTVPGRRPTSALRVPIEGERMGIFATLSTSTGVIVVNPSPAPISVTLEMSSQPGQVSMTIPAQGQILTSPEAAFDVARVGYRGTLRITSSSPIAAIAQQNLPNTGVDFVREAFDEDIASPEPFVLPHLVTSPGGYRFSITLVKTDDSQASSATIRLFSQTGDPVLTYSQATGTSNIFSLTRDPALTLSRNSLR